MKVTTLCYIEKDEKYLMLHRTKKENDINKDKCEPEMMCLFTSDDFRGEIITCDEGELEWVSKTEVPKLPTWEGDAIFLKLLLDNEERFFSLKLVYENEKLVEKAVQIY